MPDFFKRFVSLLYPIFLFLQPCVLQGLLAPLADLRVVLVEAREQAALAGFDIGAERRQIVAALVLRIGQGIHCSLKLRRGILQGILAAIRELVSLAFSHHTDKRQRDHRNTFCNYIWLPMGITQFIGDFTINLTPEFVASKISTFIARYSIILLSERSYVSSWLNAGRAKSSLNSR